MVQDAHTALTDLRSRNAEQAFSQALAIVETNTPKVIIPVIYKRCQICLAPYCSTIYDSQLAAACEQIS